MDQDTTELREDSAKIISYDFDYYALKKIHIKQNRRIAVFSIVLIILLVLLVLFVILYMNAKKSSSHGIKAKHTGAAEMDWIVKNLNISQIAIKQYEVFKKIEHFTFFYIRT